MDKNIGKKLDGRYEITELIGIGGMADVYKAIDVVEDKVVAVKILKNEFSNDDDFLRRFRNESKAIAVLSHPNIVKIYDVGFTEKIQFIVMEFIDGITLKEFMEQQGVIKWKDAIFFITQILRALQHAHDRGIVHRDIKPQNIMLFPDGTIKVMDFGIARFAREEGKTLSDKAIGSVHYISPEQARGDVTDEKSDIYSIGVMMYEMLTGQKPFDAENPVSVALMHMQTKARLPRDVNPDVPLGLEEIVTRAMQKDASKRYQSASEMIKDIEQFKKNPDILFEYKYLTNDSADTKYFNAVPSKERETSMRKKTNSKNIYSNEIDDIDDEEESKKSLFIPVLTAVAAGVVIIAAFFIVTILIDVINNKTPTLTMENLVGLNYFEAKKQYAGTYRIELDVTEYSEYEKDIIFWQSRPAGDDIKKDAVVNVKVSKGVKMVSVPDVAGLDAATAKTQMEQAGLKYVVRTKIDETTKDFVIETVPEKAASVIPGSEVILYVSLGPELQDINVPNFIGMSETDAIKSIRDDKLNIKYKIEKVDAPEPLGIIVEQSIPEGEIIKPDTEIVFKVSTGNKPYKSYILQIKIPSGAEGGYDFTAYVDGQIVGSKVVDNIGYTTGGAVDIEVKGTGVQTLSIDIKSHSTGKYSQLAQYSFDFSNGTYYALSQNDDVYFETTTEAETTPEVSYYDED